MYKIDCFGDICPLPLLKTEKHLKEINNNETFLLVTDHSCAMRSIYIKYINSNHKIELDEVLNGVWEIIITKNYYL